MKILVCGSRHGFCDTIAQLEKVADTWDVRVVVTGGARGVDKEAWDWAKYRGYTCEVFTAEWNKYGKSAGPRRNQRMIDESRPDMVVAFPGGDGTADMVIRARKAGIKVLSISETGWTL